MDIEHIRYLVNQDLIEYSNEVIKRFAEREVSSHQIIEVIMNGRIVREEKRQKKGFPKCTILGYTRRTVAGIELPEPWGLYVSCAVGNYVVIVTTYWME